MTTRNQRLVVVVWPEDHDEDISEHAYYIQDAIDILEMGGAKVIDSVPDAIHDEILAGLGGGI